MGEVSMATVGKVGIIRFSALGDIASALPVMRACREEPLIITSPLGESLLRDEFDDILVLQNKRLGTVIGLVRALRKRRLEVITDLQSNDRSKIICRFSATDYVNSNGIDQQQQTTRILHDIAMRSGCFQSLDMAPEPRERSYIVLNAGSSEKWISKRLPVEKWIEISRLLDERFGLEFVLTGSADEREYVQSLARHLPVSCRVVAGKTSLPELKGILREAFLTVSTDSGPMHISAVMKTPTMGLFGATNWIRSAPFGPWSIALYDRRYFSDGTPPQQSQQQPGPYYDNIDIEQGLTQLQTYLDR
ncbi:MAG: glycosyltransferase family 9 protein [Sedimenticola sp.]